LRIEDRPSRYGTRMQDLLREPNQTPTHDATEGAPDVV
jgi:hypothetical protein